MKKIRHAFTMVEIVAVIVIFGIIAAIGSEIYVKLYENYMLSRAMNSLHMKTELTLEQIARRLQYRIKDATIARKPSALNEYISTADAALDDTYKILEWIGYDNEGLKGYYNATTAMYMPAWSGFVDVDDSNATHLSTPGSNLDMEDNIIKSLSHNNATISDAGIIFSGTVGDYNITKYGWSPSTDTEYVYDIAEHNKTMLLITDPQTPDEIYERYKLVWTAYAIAPDPLTCTFDCNLSLYENYQPWKHEAFNDMGKNIMKFLLLEHVTTFKFKQEGDVMRLKLCAMGKVGESNISVCKEKVVF